MAKAKKTPTDANQKARRLRVMKLTLAGETCRSIETILKAECFKGCSRSTVSIDRRQVLAEMREEMIDEVKAHRSTMDARYKRQLAAHWDKAIKGNPDSMRHVTTILKRLCELHGTDEPQKISHEGDLPVVIRVTHEPLPSGKKK